MKGQALDGAGLGSVFFVPGYGMAQGGGVHADLVFAARLQRELHLGVMPAEGAYAVMGNGQLAIFHFRVEGIHLEGLGVLYQPGLDGSLLFFQGAFQPGYIFSFGHQILPFALEKIFGALVFGKYQHAGCAFVQTVDNPDFGRGAVGLPAVDEVFLALHAGIHLDVGVEEGIEGVFLFSGGYGEHSGGLVHHQVILVFEENVHAGLEHLFAGLRAGGPGNGLNILNVSILVIIMICMMNYEVYSQKNRLKSVQYIQKEIALFISVHLEG